MTSATDFSLGLLHQLITSEIRRQTRKIDGCTSAIEIGIEIFPNERTGEFTSERINFQSTHFDFEQRFRIFFTFITYSQNTKISRVRYLKPPHSVPSLQIEAPFNLDRYRYRCDGRFWYPRISEIESRNRTKNGRSDRGSTAVRSRIECSLTCSTYETEDTENGGTVAHRTKNEKSKQNQTVTVTRNTLSRSGPRLYIPPGAPGKFGAERSLTQISVEWTWGTSCRRLQSPAAYSVNFSSIGPSPRRRISSNGFQERIRSRGDRVTHRPLGDIVQLRFRGAPERRWFHCVSYTLKLIAR